MGNEIITVDDTDTGKQISPLQKPYFQKMQTSRHQYHISI